MSWRLLQFAVCSKKGAISPFHTSTAFISNADSCHGSIIRQQRARGSFMSASRKCNVTVRFPLEAEWAEESGGLASSAVQIVQSIRKNSSLHSSAKQGCIMPIPILPFASAWATSISGRAFHSAYSDDEIDRFENDIWGEEGSSEQSVDFSKFTKKNPKLTPVETASTSESDEDCAITTKSSREEQHKLTRKMNKTSSISSSTSQGSAAKKSKKKERVLEEDPSDWENTDFSFKEYAPRRRAGRIKVNREDPPLKVKGETRRLLDAEVQTKTTKRTKEEPIEGDLLNGQLKPSKWKETLERTSKKNDKNEVIDDDFWDEEPKPSKRKESLERTSKKSDTREDIGDDFWNEELKPSRRKESLGRTSKKHATKENSTIKNEDEVESVSEMSEQKSMDTAVEKDAEPGPSHLTNTRFDKFDISPLSIRVLHEVLKYERMTVVQEATFPVILQGKDVLAKAKTGTGKTIAFLLPAIEAILKQPQVEGSCNAIFVVIVCPTRELAQQAANEAGSLLRFHKRLGAQVVYGGNPIHREQQELRRKPCQILVGTPGRLVDHIKRTPEISRQLKTVKMFVLDEADHMLDMGFRDSLETILHALPSQRQTLLFSATIPKEVYSMARVALKENYVSIDTVGKDSQDTHSQVKQQYALVPLDKQVSVLHSALKEHMEAERHYKILVFCTTARVTGFMSQLFSGLGFNAREIHSKKDQSYRTRISNEFRQSTGGIILFTSDVSARGVDYPNVTLVVQFGAPCNVAQYIHRLGRTGRAGKKGEGLLLLSPWEKCFLDGMKNNPITKIPPPQISVQLEKKILGTAATIDERLRSQAYCAWLGYYKSMKDITLSKQKLVEYANQFSWAMGFAQPPPMSRTLALKMDLIGVPGLKIAR